jgi:hypothetical protein
MDSITLIYTSQLCSKITKVGVLVRASPGEGRKLGTLAMSLLASM